MRPPAGTSRAYHHAAFVPVPPGFTDAAPATTWSPIPSLVNGVVGAAPKRRATFVSFSQNSARGAVPSGAGAACSRAASGPWFSIDTRMSTSVGDALA